MSRRAVQTTKPPRPKLGAPLELPFAHIVGIDNCDARHLEPSETELAALAGDIAERGLINPLIVRGAMGQWRVLAGGRRWRALQRILKRHDDVRCRVFDGDDEEAAALSLAENIDREELHPLEEADRVAELAESASLTEVARRFGRDERWARARLALSDLPQIAREAWLEGRFGLAEAKALAGGEAKAVEALFSHPDAKAILGDARAIRAALKPRGISSRAPAARFVGVDAYVKAGGIVREDMFDDEIWFLDADLLRKLERQKLSAEADRLCEAEGWGTVLFDPGEVRRLLEPDLTEPERRALEGEGGEAEFAAILERATFRAIPKAERALYGVYVGLDSEGQLDVTRRVIVSPVIPLVASGTGRPSPATPAGDTTPGRPLPDVATHAGAVIPHSAPAGIGSRGGQAPVLHAEARRLADLAASRAAAGLVGGLTIGDALRLALAALVAKGRTAVSLTRAHGPGGKSGELARKLGALDFAAALDAAADAGDDEIEQAFCEVVATSLDLRRADDEAARGLVDYLMRLDEPFAAGFAADFDYRAFFGLAGRAFALAAIEDCAGAAGRAERAWLKDDDLAGEAARLARARDWLPSFLRRLA